MVVNTTAVDLGLGTGGWHVVHWNLAREAWSREGPGHIMKLRYTSLQTDTGVAEEDHASELAAVPEEILRPLAQREDRRIKLGLTIADDHLYLDVGGETLDGALIRGRP